MSTVTGIETSTGPANRRPDAPHLTFWRVLRSEWIKFWTLRSTYWTIAAAVILMAGIGWMTIFFTAQVVNDGDGAIQAGPGTDMNDLLHDPQMLLQGMVVAQLAIAVLGALIITGEYSTGMIRSTLTAVPRRLPALWAKGIILAVVAAVIALLGTALTWLVSLPTYNANDVSIDLGDPEVRRILLGGMLYLVGIALLAFAFGALLRHSAAAIASVLGLLLVVENVFANIPQTFFREVSPFLPSRAGQQVLQSEQMLQAMRDSSTATVLGPWQGYGVMLAWVAVLLGVAAVLLRRRDA